LLRKGISLRNVQQLTGTSVGTLRKIKQYIWFDSFNYQLKSEADITWW
jgi:uncharacterized protein YerC